MRIVFFTDTFCPTINGVVTSIVYYANELVAQGHHVLIVAPKGSELRKVSWGLDRRVVVFLAPSVNGRLYPGLRIGMPTLRLLRRIKAFHPDYVQTFTPSVVGLNGLLLSKRLHIPSCAFHMTNYTDEETLKALKQLPSSFLRPAQRGAGTLIKWFLNSHDHVFVPSEDTKQDIQSMGVIQPITVVPSPVSIEALQHAKTAGCELRKTLGIEKALITVSRLSGEKNIDRVIAAFALVLKKQPKVKLVIIGDGPDRERLFSLANALGVNQSIVWTGSIPHAVLVKKGYYYIADVFVTLSEFETQGLSTVEAMACGLQIVGADARATKELLCDIGTLVPASDTSATADAILRALNSKYRHDAKRIQSKVLRFRTREIVKTMVDQYSLFVSSH